VSRRVIILAVLVVAVGGWILLRELPALRNAEQQAAVERMIFRDIPDVVDTIRIRRPDREILLVRESGEDPDRQQGWWLHSPIVEKIPEYNARDLVDRLAQIERWRRVARAVEDGADWGLYGLAEDSPGRVRIELIGQEGRSAVDVGLLSPSSTTAWVRRVGSDELELSLADLHEVANATHHGLRNVHLFRVKHEEITRMEFRGGAGQWTAVRGEAGLWFLGSAVGPRLRRWILEDYAFAVSSLRADGYLRDDLSEADWAAYGLDQPWAAVRWQAEDEREGTLWLGNELGPGVVFGRRAGLESVFQIAPGLSPIFGADLIALRDHNPIFGNFLHATHIRVIADGGFVDIERETPGVRLATELGPLALEEYAQVAGRNLQLGIEEFQPAAEMFVPAGKDPAALLETEATRMVVTWPGREVNLTVGRMAGRVWLAIEGQQMLYEAPVDFLLRVREVLALRG